MHLDSCWMNPDGAVLHAYLYFIIFYHSRLLFVKVFTLCGAILRTVLMFLCRLFIVRYYACYRHFLRVGAPVFLVVLVFLVCSCKFYVQCICIHGFEPAIELNNNEIIIYDNTAPHVHSIFTVNGHLAPGPLRWTSPEYLYPEHSSVRFFRHRGRFDGPRKVQHSYLLVELVDCFKSVHNVAAAKHIK